MATTTRRGASAPDVSDEQNTGGRGSYGDLSEFAAVLPDKVLKGTRGEPSPLEPHVQLAADNLGQPYQRHTQGENGEDVPVTYSQPEALKFIDELRRAGRRVDLKDLSLRISTSPKGVKDLPADTTGIQIQFKVVRPKVKE